MGDPYADDPVRVCFVVENMLAAGTELWIRRLIERLDRRRVQPLLCLTDGTSENSKQIELENCPCLKLGLQSLKSWRLPSSIWRLRRFLREHDVDVVQVHHADPTYLGVPVARFSGVKAIVQTKYDVGYWLHGTDLKLHRWLRRWIDITVANCQACRDAAITQEQAPANEVVVVDNGISLDRLRAIPNMVEADFRDAAVRIGSVANLRPIKDPLNLLQAAVQLLPEFPRLSVHFAGDGELKDEMQATIVERSLQDQITLHGYVEDTAAFLGSLQIFVLCSKSEGLPHALLEAMAAGRAVVATDVGGNGELIEDGVNGLLIPPQDTSALVQAIRRLVFDPQLAVCLGHNAREHVAARFSLEAMTTRFETFYQSLLRGSSTLQESAQPEIARPSS